VSPKRKFEPPRNWSGDLEFTNADGKYIRYGIAKPDGPGRGTLILNTGYGGFIEKYFETMRFLTGMGYTVYAMDWPNQGRSERYDPQRPLKPLNQFVEICLRDLEYFRTEIVETQRPDEKVGLLAHSKGGGIGAAYLARHKCGRAKVDFAILSSPMFDIRMPGPQFLYPNIVQYGLTKVFNALDRMGFGDHHVSLTPTLSERFKRAASNFKKGSSLRSTLNQVFQKNDMALGMGDPTIGWVVEAKKLWQWLRHPNVFSQIKTPVLIGTQEADHLVDSRAHKQLAEKLPNAELVVIDGDGHNLWDEHNIPRAQWLRHVVRFLREQTAASPRPCPQTDCCDRPVSGMGSGIPQLA